MNFPIELTPLWERFASPAGFRLALALIHFLWQGFVIALLAALFTRVIGRRSPHRRYTIGLAGLLAMATAPVVTFFLITPPTLPPEITFSHTAIPATETVNAGEIPPDELTHEIHRLDALIQHLESELEEPATLPTPIPDEPRSWFDLLRDWQPYLLLLWLVGTSVCALRLAIGAQASWRYRLGRQPIPEAARETLIKVAKRLEVKPPRVFVSERVLEAIVVGLFRPMILLPAAWIGRIPPELLEAVLAHEIAHLRRHDLWINLAQRCLETLLFYHPALWWLSRRVRLEREYCCDEVAARVLDCRAAYARALEFVAAERLLASRLATLDTALVATMGGDEMALLNRVRRVLGSDPLPGRFHWRWATGGALLLPACLWGMFLWADGLVWAGGERKNAPVAAERPVAVSELAADVPPEKFTARFEKATGTSLLDEGIVVAVVCRAPGEWAWDESGWNYDIMQSVSNRFHQHGIMVRRPEQIRAWSNEHPEWDRPSDVGTGVEATHVIMIRPTSFNLFTKEQSGDINHGHASADVRVFAEQPDAGWHLIYEKEISTDRLPGNANPFNATTRRFLDPLSDQVAWLFYEPNGEKSPAVPEGDKASELFAFPDDPFAEATPDGDNSPAPADAFGEPAAEEPEPTTDGFGPPEAAVMEEARGDRSNREFERLQERNEMLEELAQELERNNKALVEQLGQPADTQDPDAQPAYGPPMSARDVKDAEMTELGKVQGVLQTVLEFSRRTKGPQHPDVQSLEERISTLQKLLDDYWVDESKSRPPATVSQAEPVEAAATSKLFVLPESKSNDGEEAKPVRTAPKDDDGGLETLREQYEQALTKQLEALKEQRSRAEEMSKRGATTPGDLIEIDKQIVEVMGKLLALKQDAAGRGREDTAVYELRSTPTLPPSFNPIIPVEPSKSADDGFKPKSAKATPVNSPFEKTLEQGEYKIEMDLKNNMATVTFYDPGLEMSIHIETPVEELPGLLERLSRRDGANVEYQPTPASPLGELGSSVPNYEDPSDGDFGTSPKSDPSGAAGRASKPNLFKPPATFAPGTSDKPGKR